MTVLTLVRGIPGTGKSTFAKTLGVSNHFEADQFFVVGGVYRFDAAWLGDAHRMCFNKTKHKLMLGEDVVVSNTFTRFKEMKQYVKLAGECGAILEVVTLTHEYGNVHNVPKEKVDEMRERFEPHQLICMEVHELLDNYSLQQTAFDNCLIAYPPNHD